MKIVKLQGGLGNQMFQYGFAKLLSLRTGEEVKLDLSAYQGQSGNDALRPWIQKFQLSLPLATEKDIRSVCRFRHDTSASRKIYMGKIRAEMWLNKRYCRPKDCAYISIEQLISYDYFDGYWQSWRYVDEVYDILRREFIPNYELHESTRELLKEIQSQNSVFIGVRRGDYVKLQETYGSFGQEYYGPAMDYIDERVANPVYYVFSNDIDWVKQNLSFGDRTVIFREKEKIINDFEDLILMMNCRHSIMVNSTYHWWGSRMNYGENKIVVAPKTWFFNGRPIDIIPPEWVTL